MSVLVIHGGAGTITPGECDAGVYRTALRDILESCKPLLVDGTSAVDIVTHAVKLLEDNPLFNAGHGSVFNKNGEHECDASIAFAHSSTNSSLSKGAAGIAGVRTLRNPVVGARAVMEKSPVALMIGESADAFAISHGAVSVPNSYFSTERRAKQLVAIKDRLGEDTMSLRGEFVQTVQTPTILEGEEETRRGTVGAVAIDANGTIAAATSTGGLTNKLPGRVGDSACIGHGTIADQRTGIAISCTGTGEAFIRSCASHELVSHVRHSQRLGYEGCQEALFREAAVATVFGEVPLWGGDGGLIALRRMEDGTCSVLSCFNTTGMYRGFVRGDTDPEVAVFGGADGDVLSIDVFQ